jgi:hypothetical protein
MYPLGVVAVPQPPTFKEAPLMRSVKPGTSVRIGLVAAVCALAVSAIPREARAQAAAAASNGIADGSLHLVISADRLMDVFSYTSTTQKFQNGPTTVETTTSGPGISLLLGRTARDNFHSIPRVSGDVVLPTPITIGGSIPFAAGLGGTRETKQTPGGSRSVDAPNVTIFGFVPRVGYLLNLSDLFSFWPRAGVGIYSQSSTSKEVNNNGVEVKTTDTTTAFSLDLDPQFVIHPVPHFGFSFGPLINIPLSGKVETETETGPTSNTVKNDLSIFHFGITASLLGWF